MTDRLSAFQDEINFDGLAGRKPAWPTDLTRLEERASEAMAPEAFGYVAGSAGSESTARVNRAAFERWRIVPRMLVDVSVRDLSATILGTPSKAPLLLAPVGVLGIAHPDGELAVARAAASVGVPMVLSTVSSHSMEEVAQVGAGRWFQLYWPKDRDVAASFLGRARDAGYAALVVTLDTKTLGWRPRDLDQAYLPFLKGLGIANYLSDPVFDADPDDLGTAILRWTQMFSDQSLTWSDLAFLREHWTGPVVLKGIQRADDARRAVDAGMDGIIVSNHGGRQVDGAVAALDMLPPVAEAVGDRIAVLFDSGIRTGADIVKALCLGARAVLVGRPYVYGLGLGGEEGVRHVLRSLLAEFDLTMALSGYASVSELGPDVLIHNPPP